MHYLRYWSLRFSPFASAAPGFFFDSASRRSAITDIHSHVVNRHSFAVLTGPSGCGATTLMKHLTQISGFGNCACEVVYTCTDDRAQPIDSLATALGICKQQDLENTLRATSQQGVRILWLLDRCGPNHAGSVIPWAARNKSITVVAALKQQVASDHRLIRLSRFSEQETGAFMVQSLRTAGCFATVFDKSAIKQIYRKSAGHLRIICELGERSLAWGAAMRVRRIGSAEIQELSEQSQVA